MLTLVYVIIVFVMVREIQIRKNVDDGVRIDPIIEQDGMLNEVHKIDVGWPNDLGRVLFLLLFIILFSLRYYDYFTGPNKFQSNEIGDGVIIGGFLSVLPILGWTPWQWGAVTVDKQELRVPRVWKVLVFDRSEKTRILTRRGSGGGYFFCLVQDESKSAQFYLSKQGLEVLRVWACFHDEPALDQSVD